MRVISGTARGTKLRALELAHLRPMLDRVKEALFNLIRDRVAGVLVLDLFSGTGGLGIEALSRGAQRCLFVEQDGRLARLLEQNVERCHLSDRAEVLRQNVLSLPLRHPPVDCAPAGLVLVDPPYAMVDDPNGRSELFAALDELAGRWIAPGALVVVHHEPMPHALWPCRRLTCRRHRIYGRSQLTLFDAVGEAEDDAR